MNDNLDIFICTHKDFEEYPENKCYKIITGEGEGCEVKNKSIDVLINEETEITPKDFAFAEAARIYWLWKNYPLKEYVGICHYRTYFSFYDNIPNMSKLFKKYDAVAIKEKQLDTVWGVYCRSHYSYDLQLVGDIIYQCFPDYAPKLEEFFNQYTFFPRNMYILKKKDFCDMCEFCFGVIKIYDKIMKLKTDDDVKELIKSRGYGRISINYQARIEGFLFERLSSFWLWNKFSPSRIKKYKIKETIEHKFIK